MSKITFDLPQEMREKAQAAAVIDMMSLSEWVRSAIREKLVRPEPLTVAPETPVARKIPRYASSYCTSSQACTATHHFPGCPMGSVQAR